MPDEVTPVVVVDPNAKTGGAGPAVIPPATVDKTEFDKVLDEMHTHKREAKAAKDQLEAMNTAKLKEQNQWQALAEAKEKEALDAKAELARTNTLIIDREKFGAVREKCSALGLRPEAMGDLEMLDLKDVRIETTSTGKVNVLGASQFADRLKTLKPHWFADKAAPGVNTNGARVVDTTGAITAQMVLDAEKEGKKSKDFTKYRELHTKFQQQRQTKR